MINVQVPPGMYHYKIFLKKYIHNLRTEEDPVWFTVSNLSISYRENSENYLYIDKF